ncbi:MAG: c-type cytochrome domain-containing protein [Ginsengibacter sp.]
MKKIVIIVTVIVSIILYACKHTPPDIIPPVVIPPVNPGGSNGSGGGPGSDSVCFESAILPIFQTNCAKSGCHDATAAQKGYVLDSYENLFKKEGKNEDKNIRPFNADRSELYEILFENGDKKMPPAGYPDLTTVQKNLIARWINEGAADTKNCTPVCDSSQFTFAAGIMPILQNHCTGCHSGQAPPNGVDLTSYDGVSPVASIDLLYGVVAHLAGFDPMPKGSGILSDCEIAQIRKWIDAGVVNN